MIDFTNSKKNAVFSTKANPSTKENIVNVFGAKTLLALIKLDLKLEMQPSKGPSTQSARNWSSQTDAHSREVVIKGHISRPVFGEGRQAPDRQMFYVNSRPCALPQVSKAFNEVYKQFNVSQSPFIFADLLMDTNAYDVNVSPDKRIILLHDQTALLESLKSALTELFETQDQSVPQSQLGPRKLSAYHPLTVSRKSSLQYGTSVGSINTTVDGSGVEIDNAQEVSSPLEDGTPAPAVGLKNSPTNLVQNWMGRDVWDRAEVSTSRARITGPSQSKHNLAKALSENSPVPEPSWNDHIQGPMQSSATGLKRFGPFLEESETEDEDAPQTAASATSVMDANPRRSERHDVSVNVSSRKESNDHASEQLQPSLNQRYANSLSSANEDLIPQRPPKLSRPVQDFNARMASQRADRTSIATEESIPAVTQGAQKSTPGPIQSAFDRMRPKRTPAQMAEIIVGDTTITTMIGTPSSKKRRIHAPKNSQSIAKFGASPLLAKGLRKFAAPGTQFEDENSSDTEEIGDHASPNEAQAESDSEDSDMPVAESFEDSTGQDPLNLDEAIGANNAVPDTVSEPWDETDDANHQEALPAIGEEDDSDSDYIDEDKKRTREDEKVARLIQEAEEATARPTADSLKRASQAMKSGGTRKDSTLNLIKFVSTTPAEISSQYTSIAIVGSKTSVAHASEESGDRDNLDTGAIKEELEDDTAEARLSLTVSKTDFARMRVAGQFNLGFIIAVRPGLKPTHAASVEDGAFQSSVAEQAEQGDHLFIIDQHAADEKFNFERLTRTTQLQPQRLVQPKQLELTAVEEEIITDNPAALAFNGFQIDVDTSGDAEVGRRCKVVSLPVSKETTFSLQDLEELLHLLSEHHSSSTDRGGEVPRPSGVRKMLAMRACRSSIMVGKTLSPVQMQRVVRNLGEMEKPWNCPHGRPTMRHLAGLNSWQGWSEGMHDNEDKGRTDWAGWLKGRKGVQDSSSEEEG